MKTSLPDISTKRPFTAAFTRLELLVCAAAVIVVLVLTFPGLANTRSRTQQAGCADNLRNIGQAVQLWALDHDNIAPWQVPLSQFGTSPSGIGNVKPHNAWFEFAFLSNILITPKILACPSDDSRVRNSAENWGNTTSGGFRNARYRNNATSYTIGAHSTLTDPDSYLSSDRNLRVDSQGQICAIALFNQAPTISLAPFSGTVGWTNGNHGLAGNVLSADGRVTARSNPDFRKYLATTQDAQLENGLMHVMIP